MSKRISESLTAAYRNPIRSVSTAEYKKLRSYHLKRGLIFITSGAIFLAFMMSGGQDAVATVSGRGGSGIAVILIGFGLPLFGLHELVMIRRIMTREIRSKLVWLHPELKALEPTRTAEGPLSLRKRILDDAVAIVIIVAIFAIWLALELRPWQL